MFINHHMKVRNDDTSAKGDAAKMLKLRQAIGIVV